MNNFNPDQNLHILSSPETPEGGAGGRNGQSNQAEQGNSELSREVLKEQEGLENEVQPDVEEGDVDSLDLPPLDSEEVQAPSDETLTEDGDNNEDLELPPLEDEPTFDTDLETGLSKALTTIESLQAQIKTLEEGGTRYQEIKSQIEAESTIEKINLEESLQDNETELNQLYTDIFIKVKAKGEFTGSEAQKSKIDEYLEKYKDNKVVSSIKTKFDTCKKQIQELTATLATFDKETESQMQAQVEAETTLLQETLSQAYGEYNGSEAEANDKKILLERRLQKQLTNPNQLFSQQNIKQIFATYGLKEGLEKLKELKQESNQAREQATRDEIRREIISNADFYKEIPELSEVLSTDIQTKLEALQQSNPESDTIERALSVKGELRLGYLVDSGDPQLKKLAFWYDRDYNIDQVIAEHPQFAQYVAKETDKRYEQQQQYIKSGRIDGERYLGSRRDNARKVEIDNRISAQLESFRSTKIQELEGELSGLKYDAGRGDYDRQDRAMLSEQEQLRPYDIKQFRTELQTALESKKVDIKLDQFRRFEISPNLNNINQEISQIRVEQDKKEQIIKALMATNKEVDYNPNKKDISGDEIYVQIDKKIQDIKSKNRFKLLGIGKDRVNTLMQLRENVDKELIIYNQLESKAQEAVKKRIDNVNTAQRLNQSYQKLPESIQNSLSSLENPNFETINQTIDAGIVTIQNYQTPPDIAEKRQKIQTLESQITETQAISSGTQPSL